MSAPGPAITLAPAKINLSLRVTGRRADGYHLLDSLVAFADCGDKIAIAASPEFSFRLSGPFAGAFGAGEGEGPDSGNLAARAALGLARLLDRPPAVDIALEKNLPLGGGIGGGSADAAAVLRGLLAFWGEKAAQPGLPGLLADLGADVPVCFTGRPARMRGAGEQIDPLECFPAMPAILVHPGISCPTAEVFRRLRPPFGAGTPVPPRIRSPGDLVAFLRESGNDLTRAACEIVPEIEDALAVLAAAPGCLISRMSGSGSTAFGLFRTPDSAETAARDIAVARPAYWVRAVTIGNPPPASAGH